MKVDILNSKRKTIFREFFLDWKTAKDVSKALYPKAKTKTAVPMVTRVFNELKRAGYLNNKIGKVPARKKRSRYEITVTKYRANLNPFYEWCKEKHDVEFTNDEKEYLELLFNPKEFRATIFKYNENTLKALSEFLLKQILLPIGFLGPEDGVFAYDNESDLIYEWVERQDKIVPKILEKWSKIRGKRYTELEKCYEIVDYGTIIKTMYVFLEFLGNDLEKETHWLEKIKICEERIEKIKNKDIWLLFRKLIFRRYLPPSLVTKILRIEKFEELQQTILSRIQL